MDHWKDIEALRKATAAQFNALPKPSRKVMANSEIVCQIRDLLIHRNTAKSRHSKELRQIDKKINWLKGDLKKGMKEVV